MPRSIFLLLFAALAGCGEAVSDITVTVRPHLPSAASPLAAVAPREVHVESFTMRRGTGVLPGRIGERKTIGDISMGMVTVVPAPERLLREAIMTELVSAGHSVAAEPAPTRIGGEVALFEFRTDVTALYWDARVDAALSIELDGPRGAVRSSYEASCVERTYAWPTAEVIARVVEACVGDLAAEFREDPDVRSKL